MQQRSGTDRRRAAERNATQPLGGQPRAGDAEEELQEPEFVPSFLSASEFDFGKDRRAGAERRAPAGGERHASASFAGPKGEPPITDQEPARGRRGTGMERSVRLLGDDDDK